MVLNKLGQDRISLAQYFPITVVTLHDVYRSYRLLLAVDNYRCIQLRSY